MQGLDNEADRIELRSLRAMGNHGTTKEERSKPQPFEVDLDIVVDLAKASDSDLVTDTVDYSELVRRAERVITGESCSLLERLAQRIADALLEDSRITQVEVCVRKTEPPVTQDLDSAGVRIVRPI